MSQINSNSQEKQIPVGSVVYVSDDFNYYFRNLCRAN